MKALLILLLLAHGLIHLLGFVKGFGLADVSQLHEPIGRLGGVLWLLAAALFVASAALLVFAPGQWWLAAAPAVVLSQIAIVTSWQDAKFGTIANAIVLVPLLVTLLDLRSGSLRSRYRHDVAQLTRAPSGPPITEADLAPLPGPVQKYLRRVGVVGRPHVHDVRLRWKGQLRNGLHAPWMKITAEQHSEFGPSPTRLFFIEGSMFGLPFDGYHHYIGPHAVMEIRAVGLFPVADGHGPQMDQSETVTVFNDMCVFAPATLVDAKVDWRPVDDRRVDATYRNAGQTIHAELHFDEQGDLVSFASNDRFLSSDGKTFLNYRWSTPLRDYRDFGGYRIARSGDATWTTPEGDFVYGRFDLEEVRYNVATGPAPVASATSSSLSLLPR